MRCALLLALASLYAAANQPAFVVTFTGNSYYFAILATAVDSSGNLYVTGYTKISLPVTADALQSKLMAPSAAGPAALGCTGPPLSGIPIGACANAFLLKIAPTGTVLYGTYLGATSASIGTGVALDPAGNVYVSGITEAPEFPTTPGAAFTTAPPGVISAFVVKLDPTLHTLLYATYIPGVTGNAAIAIDLTGNAYIGGTTQPTCIEGAGCGTAYSNLFPATTGSLQPTPKNNSSAGVIAVLNPSGSALQYASYLSGTVVSSQQVPDTITAIAVDASGDVFVTGATGAPDFPITPGAFQSQSPNSTSAAFVTELNPQGSALVFSTLLGGNGSDFGQSLELDPHGNVWLSGETTSTNFPLTANAFESTPSTHFLAHLEAGGSAVTYATYFPGTYYPPFGAVGQSLSMDASGNALLASSVTTGGLPTGPLPFQSDFGASGNIYLALFAPNGELKGATYLGEPVSTAVIAIAATRGASVYALGLLESSSGSSTYITNLVPWRIPLPHR